MWKTEKFKRGHIFFIVAFVIGVVDLIHIQIVHLKTVGIPNSLDGLIVTQYNLGSIIIALLGAPIGLSLLYYEVGHQWVAAGYWILLIGGCVTTSVSIVRSADYLVLNDDHYRDFVNFTTVRELDGRPFTNHLTSVTRKYHCCGINNLLDWELVIYALANVDANSRRYIPDMCCKIQAAGCGDKISTEVNLKSNGAEELRVADFNAWDPAFKKQVMTNIDMENDTVSMGQLFGEEICGRNKTKYDVKEIVFYREEHVTPVGSGTIPCNPQLTTCTLIRYTSIKTGREFCHWKDGKNTEYKYEKLLRMYIKDGRLYTKGCLKDLEPYVFQVCISSFFYNLILLICFLAMMAFFHIYFWEYKTAQMEAYLQPRWYVQLENETKPMHGFGDVSHMPASERDRKLLDPKRKSKDTKPKPKDTVPKPKNTKPKPKDPIPKPKPGIKPKTVDLINYYSDNLA